VRESNNRDLREAFEIPELAPLGSKKFWDFKVFPKVLKNWDQLNEKDKIVAKLIGSIHLMTLAAPFTYNEHAL
jgi:hypothetical protein